MKPFAKHVFIITTIIIIFTSNFALSVTSKINYHTNSSDFLKGKTENIVVSSKGNVQLGLAAKDLTEDFENVWSINSVVLSGGTVFIGTSPNGGVYKYSLGKLTEIYSAKLTSEQPDAKTDRNEPNAPADTNTVDHEKYLANEHIFAMATDISGRVLVGISGRKCELARIEKGKLETIYEPNDAKYIFAIAVAKNGDIYLGTGPKGKIYKLNSLGKKPKLIFDSTDKNILSLLIEKDDSLYAGTDTRGLVYKINTISNSATVLYDSDQPEIAALLYNKDGSVYAAATSADVIKTQSKFAKQIPFAGRPETKKKDGQNSQKGSGSLKLKIANTKKSSNSEQNKKSSPIPRGAKPKQASHIYKISSAGFVTDTFSEAAVLFALAKQDEKLLLGTGNEARLFSIDPATEDETIIYEDQQASQITAIAVSADEVFLGTANPAKLIKLQKTFASKGTFISDLIDAGQPAKWGKLQIEANIPQGCEVLVSSRSGNVSDINDPSFSDWTEPAKIKQPVQLLCPAGRYCQYKLILKSPDGLTSPIIREVAVANTIPNLAPKVEAVIAERAKGQDKMGLFQIKYKARDDNTDKLIYKIDFRKLGRDKWIELKDEIEKDDYEWDSRTVEDGRYEIKVTASDERSNTTETKLEGTRISEPVVIDNTAPVIEEYSLNGIKEIDSSELVNINDDKVVLKLTAKDQFSSIGQVDYTVDSNTEWIGALPDDLVFDTTTENFTIKFKKLDKGQHIIAVRIKDDLGNTTYKTFAINVTD